MRWHHAAGSLDLGEPSYLGILNLTPDSFSDGGRFQAPPAALEQAGRLIREGAALLDLGAESTRPGARAVPEAEEWARLEPVLQGLAELPLHPPLSLDSRREAVARRGLARGAAVLNNVGGFREPGMLDLALRSECGLIAMRSTPGPDSTFHMPPYAGPGRGLDALLAELREVKDRLLKAGIAPERILLDPGFGFGTTWEDDRALWEALPELPERLEWPRERFCLGISRKRFIALREGNPQLAPAQRDEGTRRAHLEAMSVGYRVFRSHALPPPRVRLAHPGEGAAIGRTQVASWRKGYQGILPEGLLAGLDPEREAAACEARLAAHPKGLLVLERADRIQGFAALSRETPVPELEAIYLHPGVWGLGLGRFLHDAALEALRAPGADSARLWVLERNPRAQAFFQRQGWAPDGGHRTSWHAGIALREFSFARPL